MARNITPRAKDYSAWYLDVIKAAELADHAPVRGCMVVRPGGWALWEGMQRELDRRFKDTGHTNAAFPLLIPISFLAKEAKHIEGFAMECAVVTHSGLALDEKKEGLVVRNQLEEPYVVRPTSETVIGHMYAQWVQSWRDLPILINQWANVMRWEMRTRLFLRTSEFYWQEGHTAHETSQEAMEETRRMLGVYREFAETVLAIPVFTGEKTERERFPGADHTFAIEALMQDNKALQAGTSHDLGQNFSRAFNISFEGRDQTRQFAFTTSWGVSTRLIGALIMSHSDDEGLVLPPKIAPNLVAIIPIYKSESERESVLAFAERVLVSLCGEEEVTAAKKRAGNHEIFRAFFHRASEQYALMDRRDEMRPGEKHFYWEQRGVPLRIEIGPRDVAQGNLVLKSRLGGDKEILAAAGLSREWLDTRLAAFQRTLFERALNHRESHTRFAATKAELYDLLKQHGGFVRCFLAPDTPFEEQVKADTKATVRVILDPEFKSQAQGRCISTGHETDREVVFAVAY